MKITDLKAYLVYDSRGIPTVACNVCIDNNVNDIAMVPSGNSTGSNEMFELRDRSKDWFGYGVNNAIDNINNIIKPKLIGLNPLKQSEIDNIMIKLDNSFNKSNLGSNAILAVSIAIAKTVAKALNIPIYKYINKYLFNNKFNYKYPFCCVNVINGGKHANNNLDFQEFMFIPLKGKNIDDHLKIADECFLSLQNILYKKNISIAKGDEGGFSINANNLYEIFDLLIESINNANYVCGKDVGIGIDIAASQFYKNGKYNLKCFDKSLSGMELIEFYNKLILKYPIVYIEDPFYESDWNSFITFTKLHNDILIVGDDLYCTNSKLLNKGYQMNATNSIIIKLNQIGTLSECLDTINNAIKYNMNYIISHRSGDTEDSFIADLAVGTNAKLIKTGSMARSERLAKYNRLITINNLYDNLSSYDWRKILKSWE